MRSEAWTEHGTKIMGWLVAILGAVTSFKDRIALLFFTERGDQIFFLVTDVLSYLIIGAGAIIIRRGYTNTRRAGETPFVPGEDKGAI